MTAPTCPHGCRPPCPFDRVTVPVLRQQEAELRAANALAVALRRSVAHHERRCLCGLCTPLRAFERERGRMGRR